MIGVALFFVGKYVFRYYLNYNEPAYTGPLGAPNYWTMRAWLLLHITGGMVALLSGPFQFSKRLRTAKPDVHHTIGYVFLLGVAMGCIGAFRLAISTTFGWAFGVGLVALALAWSSTAGMALHTAKRRYFQAHREWMVRAYIITFAFVTFRLLNDYGPVSHLQPPNDRANVVIWACWVLPLMIADPILQLQRLPRRPRAEQ
jgi:hypothetical protein